MIRIVTLGTLDLTAPSPHDLGTVVAQPKRAALLVYLALATPRGWQRRDRLLALLWPELDEQHGRSALRQAVYRLRQSLGKEAIASRGDEELRVDPALVTADAGEFEQLLAEGRPAEALGLYRGEFLAGFHVAGASEEWEAWVERERARLRHKAQDACRLLAREEERKGNGVSAAGWARRALELTPDDEATALDLLKLLLRLGDRSGALRAGTAFVAHQRALLGAEPSSALVALLDEFRRSSAPVKAAAPGVAAPVSPATPSPGAVAAASAGLAPSASGAIPARGGLRGAWVGLLVGLAVLVTGALLWRPPGSPAAATPLVAVGSIRSQAPEADRLSAPTLRDLLSSGLAQLPGLEVLSGPRLIELETQLGGTTDPAAASYAAAKLAGATLLLEGDLRRDGDSLRLDLRATELPRGAIRYTIRASATTLFALADAATAQVAGRSGVPAPVRGTVRAGTRSEIAYRFYLEGLRAYYAVDQVAARRLFDAAIHEDSSFAMAWLYAARAAADPARYIPYLRQAVRLAPEAPERERLTILARWGVATLDPVAQAYADTLAVRYPSEPANLMLLAQSRVEFGANAAAIEAATRVLALDSLGIAGRSASCYACDAWATIIAASLALNRPEAALAAAREWVRHQPHSAGALRSLHGVLVRMGRYPAADSVLLALDSIGRPDPSYLRESRLRRGQFAELLTEVAEAAGRGTEDEKSDARWWWTIALRAQGRYQEALAVARSDRGIAEAQALCESGATAEGARRYETIANAVLRLPEDQQDPAALFHRAKHRAWHLTHAAMCLAMGGDTTRLAQLADTIQAVGARTSWPRDQHLHFYVRGLLARARGDTTGAIALFREANVAPVNGYSRIDYDLADLLLARGQVPDAIHVLQAAMLGPADAGGVYLTRTALEQRLAQAFRAAGMADSARVHEAYVALAWQGREGDVSR